MGSAFCIQTRVSRPPGSMTEKISLDSGLAWAPATSALKARPEPPCATGIMGTCCLISSATWA